MPISESDPLLAVEKLRSGYGNIPVLHDIGLTIRPGEAIALLGPNGAGKTTLLRAISGLLPSSGGRISFSGKSISGMGPAEIIKLGLGHVIEGHRVFTGLSVLDNLLLAGFDVPRQERVARADEVLSYFPEIAAKRNERGGALSGGQQQMLAVAQGLVRRPRLLMLDEPSAGLSPVLVDRVLSVLRQLCDAGTSVLLVEQLVEKALAFADRVYVLSRGQMVMEADTSEAGLSQRLEQAYLGGAQDSHGISEHIPAG